METKREIKFDSKSTDAKSTDTKSTNVKSASRLHFRIKNLPDLDVMSKTDSRVLAYTRGGTHDNWKLFGSTETIVDNLNPRFTKTIPIQFTFERTQELRFVVVDLDDKHQTDHIDLVKIIGSVETNLGKIMTAPKSRLTLRLTNEKGNHIRKNETDVTEFRVSLETVQHNQKAADTKVSFDLKANDLVDMDFFGKSDPFCQIWRCSGESKMWTMVTKTLVIDNNLGPAWGTMTCSLQDLGTDDKTDIKFIVLDDDGPKKTPEVIGQCLTTLGDLKRVAATSCTHSLTRPGQKKTFGQLTISKFTVIKPAVESTIENFLANGLDIRAIFGIDFTQSNRPDEHNPAKSLHYLAPGFENPYQRVIKTVGTTLDPFNRKQLFDVFGFGAKIFDLNSKTVMVSHNFSILNSDGTSTRKTLTDVENSYKGVFQSQNFELWGPTNFAPIIDAASNLASTGTNDQKSQQYTILAIVTDGAVSDFAETRAAIVRASASPLSILIIGVGNADFSKMKELDGDGPGKLGVRDIVQFVAMNDFIGRPPSELSAHTLAEIPGQILSWYKMRNLNPLEKE